MGYQSRALFELEVRPDTAPEMEYLRTLTRSPGTRSELKTSLHFPSRKAWTGYGVILIVLNSVRVLTRYSSVPFDYFRG